MSARLKRVRWPDEIPGNNWKFGTQKAFLIDLVNYWRYEFDWREQEATLNQFSQFTVDFDKSRLHFIHEKGKGPKPFPLLITHGWPGSVFEFNELIPMLTDPEAFGGDASDAFTVVAPSLPGYAFSFTPNQNRYSAPAMADIFARLMPSLGYSRFGAQGGDWGSFVTTRLGYAYPELLYGIHLNMLAVRRDPRLLEGNVSPEVRQFEKELKTFLKEETGYQWIQGTKPQTLSYALNDSPVGLAAWLVEKYFTWTDCKGDLDSYLGKNKLVTSVMIYWVTNSIGSSFWPYYARMHEDWILPEGAKVKVPTGYVEFPKEIVRPPREIAMEMYPDLRKWTVASEGGHFAAMEQPKVLAQEIRDFFREFR